MWVQRTAGAVILAASALGIASGLADADPTPAPPPAAPKTTIGADGVYAVGTDIVPGVYASAGPVGNGTCYWKRTGNPDGATVDNALTKQPQTIQIDATDKAFKTSGCQPWQLTDGPAPQGSSVSPIMAGLQLKMYLDQLNAKAAASGQLPPP